MDDVNEVIFTGGIFKDAETFQGQKGAVTKFILAVGKGKFFDKESQQWKGTTSWVKCVCFQEVKLLKGILLMKIQNKMHLEFQLISLVINRI